MTTALDRLSADLNAQPLVRYFRGLMTGQPDLHMKDQTVEAVGPDRRIKMRGRWVVNFGTDSSLGFDTDPRIQDALRDGVTRWGAQIGSSRAFSQTASNREAEVLLAEWMGTEDALLYPSVTLANHGALPALAGRRDAIAVDQYAHHCVHTGAKLAGAHGARVGTFAHNDPDALEHTLKSLRPYRTAVVAVDGVYSMTGTLPRLAEFREVARRHDAILYVDDAHATGLLGDHGRGTVQGALGDYADTLVVGSLSKAMSCAGGFVACPERVRLPLAIRSGPIIFGGPVPPMYLDAICVAVRIVRSGEYAVLRGRLTANVRRFVDGLTAAGVPATGGVSAIVAVPVGDEGATLRAGKAVFDAGYYVQSVVFPAVPHRAGLLRVQLSTTHHAEDIAGLVAAVARAVRPG